MNYLSYVGSTVLHMSDYSILGRSSGTFTYISDAHLTTSWLDHVLCSYNMNLLINSLHVLDKLPCSDHLPMVVIFDIDINVSLPTQVSTDDVITSFNWSKATVDDISSYSRTADIELRSINVPGGLMCRDMHCHDVHHLESIDVFYSDICNALAHSSAQCIDVCRTGSAKDFIVPGFNEHVKTLHTEARNAYIIWRNIGRPRVGETCFRMRTTRLAFKYALRQCKCLEDTMRANALATSLLSKDTNSFWKHVSVSRNKKVCTPTKVDDRVGDKEITDMWRNHYSTLLNSVHSSIDKDRVLSHLNDCSSEYSALSISVDDVSNGLKLVKLGKSCGVDGLSAEHFIYAGNYVKVYLSILFTSFISHGYLPDGFMKSAIIPLIKNKTGDTNDKNNYRPIALVTAMSKIFELCLSEKLNVYLTTSDNQFGFKAKHSTDMCIYAVKSVVKYYNHFHSPVYTCFLDASKAFDRINHWTLFSKLIARGVPCPLVRIIMFWYRTQTICVKWGKLCSSYFSVSNGVRQGGILSPKLFSVYVDDLSVALSATKTGCVINNKSVNHVFYADDLCIMSASPAGLQKLIDI